MARVLGQTLDLAAMPRRISRLAQTRFAPPHVGQARLAPAAHASAYAYAT